MPIQPMWFAGQAGRESQAKPMTPAIWFPSSKEFPTLATWNTTILPDHLSSNYRACRETALMVCCFIETYTAVPGLASKPEPRNAPVSKGVGRLLLGSTAFREGNGARPSHWRTTVSSRSCNDCVQDMVRNANVSTEWSTRRPSHRPSAHNHLSNKREEALTFGFVFNALSALLETNAFTAFASFFDAPFRNSCRKLSSVRTALRR